jgi:hypothetical protein
MPTLVGSTQVTIPVSSSDLAAAGTETIAVTNPSPGGGQASAQYSVGAPAAPTVSSIMPASIAIGSGNQTLTVTGSNFVQNSTVEWNGSRRATTYVSNTQLQAAIPAADFTATVGSVPISVVTSMAGGGGISASVGLLIDYPLPTISSLSPASVVAGGGAFTLTVNGSDFVPGATVYWNNINRVTTYVNSGELTAAILASDVAATGATSASVTVENPSPSEGISNAAAFVLANPSPTVASISPNTGPAGPGFSIMVTGSGFVPGATIQFGGQTVQTYSTLTTATSVTGFVSSAAVGNFSVTVTNPGSAPSNAVAYNSAAVGPATALQAVSIDANGNIINTSPGTITANGRYFAFGNLLRDTCIGGPTGCTPATTSNGAYVNGSAPVSATDDGRYILSQNPLNYHVPWEGGDVELTDTCLGASADCSPATTILVNGGVDDFFSMTPDGRYISYALVEDPRASYIYDTCIGGAPDCVPEPQLEEPTTTSVPSLSRDGRYSVFTESNGSSNTQFKVVLHDSCLGDNTSGTCVVNDTVISDTAKSCSSPAISDDASFVTYACLNSDNFNEVFAINTCIGAIGSCTPQTSQITSYTAPYGNDSVPSSISTGGRYVLYLTKSAVVAGFETNENTLFVYDTCNGVSSACTPKASPVCLNGQGALANGDCSWQGTTSDGGYIAFSSQATNLIDLPAGVTGVSYVAPNPLK